MLATNERAISVYKKNGFKEEGKFKDHLYVEDTGYQDLMFMGRINPYE